MILDSVKNSTADNVLGIFNDDVMTLLGIDKSGVYSDYIVGTEKAEKEFAELIAGAEWSDENAASKFKENSIVAAYRTVTDYTKYGNLINVTKTDLGLSGNYFMWKSDLSRYEVNKLMIANAAELTDYTTIKAKFDLYVSQTTDKDSVSGSDNSGSGSGGSGSKVEVSSSSKGMNAPVVSTTVANPQPTQAPITDEVIAFDDLIGYEWASESIYNLAKHSIVDGTGDGKYEPERPIKKEELTKLLVEAFDIPTYDTECSFSDVPQTAWYYDYVAAINSAEIAKGVGDGVYGAGTDVTREDMCVMISNVLAYKGYDIASSVEKINFRDEEHMSSYAKDAIEKMQMSGIVNGMSDDVFEPKTPTNRAMAAVVIERTLKLLGKI